MNITPALTAILALPSRRFCRMKKVSGAVAFLKAAIAYYKSLGVTVAAVMTGSGPCYKAFAFQEACRDFGFKHIRIRPYTPQNQQQDRTLHPDQLAGMGLRQAYPTSGRRAEALPIWLHRYNWHRPHRGIKYQTPSVDSASPRTTCRGSTNAEYHLLVPAG